MKKYFVIDLDGTIYRDTTILPGAKEFIDYLKTKNHDYVFFTNSPQRSKEELADKLNKLGIACLPKDFLSTVDVCINYLPKNAKIKCLGSISMEEQFKINGFKIVNQDGICDYVIIGYAPNINLKQINEACYHIYSGSKVILCNRDETIPTPKGFIAHTGAICDLIQSVTKVQSIDIGKPTKITLDYLCDYFKCTNKDLIIVGDNLKTDIALAIDHGLQAYLLLSGLTTKNEVKDLNLNNVIICSNLHEVVKKL